MQALEPEHKRSRRHHPKIDAPQAWYYRQEYGDAGEVFLCLANAGGQASRRVFDMGTGRLLGDILIREGDYRHAFPEDITGAIRLNGSWSERDMENWGTEMPMATALDSLHTDLEAARYGEMSSTGIFQTRSGFGLRSHRARRQIAATAAIRFILPGSSGIRFPGVSRTRQRFETRPRATASIFPARLHSRFDE